MVEPAYFLVDDIPLPDESSSGAPKALVDEAQRSGAWRKYLATGQGGFHSQISYFPPGFAVPLHSHDHDELIVVLEGGCTMLGDSGPTLGANDSMVLAGGHEYGFTAGPDGMTFMTIRTGKATTEIG